MTLFTVGSEAAWTALAAAAAITPFSPGDIIRITADFSFTAVPTRLAVGAALLNGNAQTISMNFTSGSINGFTSLAGGTIRNLNIVMVQPWSSAAVLLADNSYGTVKYISITGTITTGATIIRSAGAAADKTLDINHVAVNITATSTHMGLVDGHVGGTVTISYCSIVINCVGAITAYAFMRSRGNSSIDINSPLTVTKSTVTFTGSVAANTYVFGVISLATTSTTVISVSEIWYRRVQTRDNNFPTAYSNGLVFLGLLCTNLTSIRDCIFNTDDALALLNNANSLGTPTFTRCVHVASSSTIAPSYAYGASTYNNGSILAFNCYGVSEALGSPYVVSGTTPVTTGSDPVVDYTSVTSATPLNTGGTTYWQTDGSRFPIIASLVDETTFVVPSGTHFDGTPTVLLSVPPYEDTAVLCFAPGTMISLTDGSKCAVEKVEPGMMLANASERKPLQVQALIHSSARHTVTLPAKTFRYQTNDLVLSPWHLVRVNNQWLSANQMRMATRQRHTKKVPLINIETDKWGCILANGVPCETASCTPEQKKKRERALATKS